jgi:DNA-binding MarR family transcriptional regulator
MASTEALGSDSREGAVGAGSQTLMRGLDVIEAVAHEVLSHAELADRLGLTKSTAHRLASALVERGSPVPRAPAPGSAPSALNWVRWRRRRPT